MAVKDERRPCEISGCVNDAEAIIGTLRDLPDRDDDTIVTLHVCAGHKELMKSRAKKIAIDERNVLIERPQRKAADWCRICDGACKVGAPGIRQAHEGGV